MNLTRLLVFVISFVLLGSIINAEEKKLKFRGIGSDSELKPVQINISPDLLKTDEFFKLKSEYKAAKNFAIKINKNLKNKKKVKFRSANAGESPGKIYKNYARSVVFIYNATEGHEGTGAGFLIDSSGVILTNWHVTDKAKNIFVWLLPE